MREKEGGGGGGGGGWAYILKFIFLIRTTHKKHSNGTNFIFLELVEKFSIVAGEKSRPTI